MEDLLTGGRGDDEVSSSVTGSRGGLSGENKSKTTEGQVLFLRKGEEHHEEEEEFSSRRGDQHNSRDKEEEEEQQQQQRQKGGDVGKSEGYQKRVSLLLDLSEDGQNPLQAAPKTRGASDQSAASSSFHNEVTPPPPPRVIVSSASPPPSLHRTAEDGGTTADLGRREKEEEQQQGEKPLASHRVSRDRNTSLDNKSADVSRSTSTEGSNHPCPTGGVVASKPSSVPPTANTTGSEDDEALNELQTWIGSPKGGGLGEEENFFLLPPSISADKKRSGDGLGTGSDHGEAFSPISSLGGSELRSRRASSDEEEDDDDDGKDNASSPRSIGLKDSREEVRGEAMRRKEQEELEGQELIELKKDQEKQNEDKVRDIMSCKEGSPHDKEEKIKKTEASDQVDSIREETERSDEREGKKTSISLLDSDLVQDSSSSSPPEVTTVSPGPPPAVLSSAPAHPSSSTIDVRPSSSSSGAEAFPGGSLEGQGKSLQRRESQNNRSSQSRVERPSSSAVSSSSFDDSSSSQDHPPADLDLTYTRTINPSGVHRRGVHGTQAQSSGYPSSSSSSSGSPRDRIYSSSSLPHTTAPAARAPSHPYGTPGFHSSPAICSSSHSSPATATPAAAASRYPSFPSAASPPSLARCSVRSFPQPGGAGVSSDYTDGLHYQHQQHHSSNSRNQKYMQFFDQEKSSEEDLSGGRLKGPSRSSLFSSSSSSSSDFLPRTHSSSASSSFSRQPLTNAEEGHSSSSSRSARSAVSITPGMVDTVVDAAGGEMKKAGEGKGRSGREVAVGSLAAIAEAAVGGSSSIDASKSFEDREEGKSRKEGGGDTRTLKRYMLSGVTSGAEAEVASPSHYGDLQVSRKLVREGNLCYKIRGRVRSP